MGHEWTSFENVEIAADSVVAELESLERHQFGETFETGEADVDHAQTLQEDILLCEAFDLGGAAIVQDEVSRLKRN